MSSPILGYNPLADPEFARHVAELFASGASNKKIMEATGVKAPQTIAKWRRDPRVRAHLMPLIQDRIVQITRSVDNEIVHRLTNADELTVRELIDIRKEFLGGDLRATTEKADDETVIAAMSALERDPGLVEKLDALFSDKAPEAPEAKEEEAVDAEVSHS
jgi:transposase-like protein